MAIKYRKTKSATHTDVILDGVRTGSIVEINNTFSYWPKGCNASGESFPTLDACKASVEGTEKEPYLHLTDPNRCEDCPHTIHSGNCAHCEHGTMCNPYAPNYVEGFGIETNEEPNENGLTFTRV